MNSIIILIKEDFRIQYCAILIFVGTLVQRRSDKDPFWFIMRYET